MTDRLTICYHALWILGLAIILAAFSYSDWRAARQGLKLRQVLNLPSFQIPLSLGLMFVSLALVFLGKTWWERLIWLAFVGIFAFQLWQMRK